MATSRPRTSVGLLAVAVLAITAGCFGGAPGGTATAPDTTAAPTTTADATARTTTAASSTAGGTTPTGTGPGTRTDTADGFDFEVVNVTECGDQCRSVTAELTADTARKPTPFRGGRKRVRSMQQSTDYSIADSPTVHKNVNKE